MTCVFHSSPWVLEIFLITLILLKKFVYWRTDKMVPIVKLGSGAFQLSNSHTEIMECWSPEWPKNTTFADNFDHWNKFSANIWNCPPIVGILDSSIPVFFARLLITRTKLWPENPHRTSPLRSFRPILREPKTKGQIK